MDMNLEEEASETKEELRETPEAMTTPPNLFSFDARKSSKYEVQPLSSEKQGGDVSSFLGFGLRLLVLLTTSIFFSLCGCRGKYGKGKVAN